MFKQFIQNYQESQVYLIGSLMLFLVFFALVVWMLFKMNKKHIDYMSQIPLKDNDPQL